MTLVVKPCSETRSANQAVANGKESILGAFQERISKVTRIAFSYERRATSRHMTSAGSLKKEARMPRKSVPVSHLRLKRAYEPAAPEDGMRILVDRLWPRGISKEKASLDEWEKEIAPSTELRQRFDHDPERWTEFQRRYRSELQDHVDILDHIRALARKQTVTLVYSAHDEKHNDAVVLRDVLVEENKSSR
jgi:uncharacterized protein YeaO (DUF488 family)